MTTTYQGHMADGSSIQKHSAGGAYPGCWKCTSRTAGQMVYRQADNAIVG